MNCVAGIVGRRDGTVTFRPPPTRMKNVDDIPDPDWSLFPMEGYIAGDHTHGMDMGRSMPIMASRSCPYECTFCSSPFMWTTLWRAREPQNVINEMKRYMEEYKVTNFDFYDLTAIVKRDWIVGFSKMVIDQLPGITWQLPSDTRSEAIDAEVVELLYASGCRQMNYAPESCNPEILKRIKKKVKSDRMLESMGDAVKNRISVKANIMMGFPDEKKRDLIPTFRFMAQMAWVGVDDVSLPGSRIFQRAARKENRQVG